MEDEVEKCFERLQPQAFYNVIVMTNRISAEWCDHKSSHLRYPEMTHNSWVKQKVGVISLKHVVYQECGATQYLSEDFSIYPTFHCVYSFGSETRDRTKKDILEYYKSIDPKLKLVRYGDYDINFIF